MDRGAWQATAQRVAESDMPEHTTPTHNVFIHSSVDGHLGYLHVLAVVNSATVNSGVQMSLEFWFS